MTTSTSNKFTQLATAKEQIRKSINKKGVVVTTETPIEQYSNKIESIYFYNLEDANFNDFISSYFVNIESATDQFMSSQITDLDSTTISYLNKMGFKYCTSVQSCFYNCPNLTLVDGIELYSTGSCDNMFSQCANLSTVNLTVSSPVLKTTQSMFDSCRKLKNLILNISTEYTASDFTCERMFGYVPLNNLATSSVSLDFPKYERIFAYTTGLASLNFLSTWDFTSSTSAAPSWSSLFYGIVPPVDLTLPNSFTYTPPGSLYNLFSQCTDFEWTSARWASIQAFLDSLDLSNVSNMNYFCTCPAASTKYCLDLDIRLPVDGQDCSIECGFYTNTTRTYAQQGVITSFSFNGKGGATSIFSEYPSYLDNTGYHPKTYIGSLNLPYVTSLRSAFQSSSFLTGIDSLITGSDLKDTGYMFYDCKRLTTVPLFDTESVTYASYMFYDCSSLQTIPAFNFSAINGNSSSMSYMFYNCSSLVEIPAIDLANLTNNRSYTDGSSSVYYMFYGCSNLEQVKFTNIKVSLDLSYSTKFTRAALNEVIGNLVNVGSSRTLHIGSTNLAKLTAEDIAVATEKGWTLN